MIPLTWFLTGAGTDAAGRTHADIIAMTDDELEHHHDYIQWLFPLPHPETRCPQLSGPDTGGFGGSPVIGSSPHAHSRSSGAHVRLLLSYTWMACRYDHNHLRITRIIRSLRLIVGDEPANAFRTAIMARVEEAGAAIPASTIAYWNAA
jgi:hypothetical protein